ncbi:MAG: ABC transporter substrate-binding protein [Pseudonocardiaceae bacterium]|nr:ABC transporter substrate-binding protein [Pseudonocardiaceae bacterium]
MSRLLPLSVACGDYDRTQALRTGDVTAEGASLTYLTLPVEETFFRMVSYREFDVAEMSLSTYVMTLREDPEDSPFVAIPVFPSRVFRHSGIYVNTHRGIEEPADLVGRTIGVPEYQITAAVWIRGILAEHHGVPIDSVRYRTGGLHAAGRAEKVSVSPPAGVEIEPIPAGATLAQLLVSGEIDALYSARTPEPFDHGCPDVRRLFQDPAQAEAEYFRATGIFPIMHTVVLRRDLYRSHRWLARSLMKAFEAAKAHAMTGIDETAAVRYMLPWLYSEVRRTREIMGTDYWPYGIPRNEETLRVFLRYSYEQGLAAKPWEPDDLFAPETRQAFVI